MSIPGRIPVRLRPLVSEIVALYNSGLSYSAVAHRYGTNQSAISAIVVRHGKPRDPNALRHAEHMARLAEIAPRRKGPGGVVERIYCRTTGRKCVLHPEECERCIGTGGSNNGQF